MKMGIWGTLYDDPQPCRNDGRLNRVGNDGRKMEQRWLWENSTSRQASLHLALCNSHIVSFEGLCSGLRKVAEMFRSAQGSLCRIYILSDKSHAINRVAGCVLLGCVQPSLPSA